MTQSSPASRKLELLEAFLNLYWLRPETALWRTIDCLALEEVAFQAPIVDIGCGDGLFSFTRAGGRLDVGFDAFVQVGNLDSFFDKVDIYNHFDGGQIAPIVTRKTDYTIDVGFDHKEALLQKAFSTGLYRQVKVGDANRSLPFEAGAFRTVFSNILYWLDDFPTTLREMARIVSTDGRVILHVPNSTFRDYSFYQRLHARSGDPAWAWLHLLDRGRSDNIRHCKSRPDWETEFAQAGLKVAHHRQYLSKTVLEAWDIGLRPISPYLIEMANRLPPEDRAEIKRKWIEGVMPLIAPLCELDWPTDAEYPPGFHLFVLEKAA